MANLATIVNNILADSGIDDVNVAVITGSNQFNGSQAITGSLTVTGQVVAQTLNVQQVTSSIVYSSGSNVFGNSLGNTQQFTGSVNVTGSLTVTTTGTELQVTSTGVNLGNALTDSHIISGSLRVNPNGLFVSGSGNVGIGTNTPSEKLDVVGGGLASGNGTIKTGITYSSLGLVGTFSNHDLGIITNGTERMRITNSGSIGIGVTPSSNWNTRSVIQLGAFGTSLSGYNGGGGATQLMHNAVANGFDYTYLNTGGATSQYMDGSDIVWGNAPSGTAGNAITFAERMRITSGGNVGIGTTGGINVVSGWTNLTVNGSTTGLFGIKANEVDYGAMYASTANNNFVIQAYGASNNGNMVFLTASTERMRITSTGIACFACQVCAPSGVKFGAGSGILNYYEQGTWTPRLSNGSFTTNADTGNTGWYIRIGNSVTVGGTLVWTGGSGAQDGNSLRIECLPFAANNAANQRSAGSFGASSANSIGFKNQCAQMTLVIDPGASFIALIQNYQDGTYLTYRHDPCANTSGILYGFSVTYQI
jgi:hypothetical protein